MGIVYICRNPYSERVYRHIIFSVCGHTVYVVAWSPPPLLILKTGVIYTRHMCALHAHSLAYIVGFETGRTCKLSIESNCMRPVLVM